MIATVQQLYLPAYNESAAETVTVALTPGLPGPTWWCEWWTDPREDIYDGTEGEPT